MNATGNTPTPWPDAEAQYPARLMRQVARLFRVRPRDLGFGVEHPRRAAMHTAYRAKTRRRPR